MNKQEESTRGYVAEHLRMHSAPNYGCMICVAWYWALSLDTQSAQEALLAVKPPVSIAQDVGNVDKNH